MFFDVHIPVWSIILFSTAFICLAYIAFVYCRRIRSVSLRRAVCDEDVSATQDAADVDGGDVINIDVDPRSFLPFTSVVVYSRSDADMLAKSLPAILDQKFDGRFEVIVVNDGNVSDLDTVVAQLKAKHHNLYLTFTPDGSRVLSSKKLAVTLGVKAAKGDVIVLTDATAMVATDTWLQNMVKPFMDSSVEVVLGYNRPAMPEGRWRGRLLHTFDSAADAVAWMSSALSGRPYRGCSSNMSFRRQLFFDHKGFSQSLNLRYGIDDLFVDEITDSGNSVVVISESTIGRVGYPESVGKDLNHFRLHHAFTGKSLPKASRRIMALGEWLMWTVVGLSAAGALLAGVTNCFGWLIAAVIIISMIVVVTVFWRRAIASLGFDKMLLTIPFMAASRPVRNIFVNLRCSGRKVGNFTWQPRRR